MKVRQITIDFFSKRERQMTRNYLAMLMMFAHLAIKERQIASNFFSERECPVITAISFVCLTKQIIQKEIFCLCFIAYMGHLNLQNILFMFHHIHVPFKFREFGAAASKLNFYT
jgi:hypothetical protein